MGIRESFQEHPPGEDLNIHDISIEREEREEPLFDFDNEITDSDWQEIKNRFRPNELENLSYVASSKIAFPERSKEFECDDKLFDDLKMRFDKKTAEYVEPNLYRYYYENAAQIKSLFPEKEPLIKLDEKCWQDMENELNKLKNGEDMLAFSAYAVTARLLFPKKDFSSIIDNDVWEKIKKSLSGFRSKSEDWSMFHRLARRMKILRPKQSEDLGIGVEKLKEMKGWLKAVYASAREGHEWKDFVNLAASIKILAAHKVEVTDEGLEITMRKPKTDFHVKKTPRPVRRQF